MMKNITDIRKLAEEMAALSPNNISDLSADEIKQIFHELKVHQIELEMQNDEIRNNHIALDISNRRYFDLYDMAPVGYLTVNEHLMIIESNLTAANLLGTARKAIVNYPFSKFIYKEDQDIYYNFRKKLLDTKITEFCELRMVKKDKTTFWGRLTAVAVSDDDRTDFRITIIDITDNKLSEEIINNYRDDLEKQIVKYTAIAEDRANKLQTLSKQFIHAEEKERNKISHLLHEDIQQILVAARLTLNIGIREVTETAPRTIFANVDRMLYEAITEVRTIAHQIMPTELYEKGLQDAILNLAQQMSDRFNFIVEVITDERISNICSEVSICAYQAVREMLLNIDKHAKVRNGKITFCMLDNEHFQLTVSDCGTGFVSNNILNPEDYNIGFGLFNIKKQIEGLGGKVEITSSTNKGTSICLLLPLKIKKSKNKKQKID
jgi:PAS domain S-box-containing protein